MKKKLGVLILVICLVPSLVNAAAIGNSDSRLDNGTGQSNISQQLSIDNTAKTTSSAGCKTPKDIPSLFTYVLCVLDGSVVPFLIGLGLILFLVGVVKFVGAGDNEEKRQTGREMMIFGIIALFVMVSVWGFVNILSNSFFGNDSEIQSLPRKSTTIFKQ